MRASIRATCALSALSACAAFPLAGLAGQPPRSASPLVAWVQAAGWDELHEGIPTSALDLTAADVPALAALLVSGSEPQQLIAGQVLGYGGGDAAIAALRASRQPIAVLMLPLALMARGTAADRADLVRSVEDTSNADAWPARSSSALGLGLLRATEAIPTLEPAARGTTAVASDARQALRWIREGRSNVDALPAATDEDRIIAAALRHGIPSLGDSTLFNDDDRGGTWILDGEAWRYRSGGRAADAPSLGFSVRFNADRSRAILAVSLVCGPLCGVGFDYVLTREPNGWTLRALTQTWVS